ncbi:MAG TPA: hypothetical protein VK835_13825 [Bacteroidia bacterium]|jgi:hypothetical protein|nr:hypothetical protein [Bacteroidia bacterium]
MNKLFLLFIAIVSIANQSMAQNQKAITESGKSVILLQNGTWKYEVIKRDTTKANTNSTDCHKWIATTTDKVTGDITTAAKKNLIVSTDGGKKGFGIFMMRSDGNNYLYLFIQAVGAGSCIDKDATINILFTDDSKLEMKNIGDYNCKGESTINFQSPFDEDHGDGLSQLRTKKIQTMRVWTTDSYVERNFTPANQMEFLNVINCLTKYPLEK